MFHRTCAFFRCLILSMLCFCMSVRALESFLKSASRAELVEMPILAPFRALAAKLPHQAVPEPFCGTAGKAIALVFVRMSWTSEDLS